MIRPPENINLQWWCWLQLKGINPNTAKASDYVFWNNQMLGEWSKTKGLKGRQEYYSMTDIQEYRQWLLSIVEEKSK